ncbi:MAG: hypothetical protein ISN28_06585 [Ectothiorhodospiraceae bacterium AqS1]|nr:hypothetical protein [Ectothiorhodospiraceae bacterium AqS1]
MNAPLLATCAICALIYMMIDIWRYRDLLYALAGVPGWVVAAILGHFTNGHSTAILFAIAIGVGVGVALQHVIRPHLID